MSSVRFGIDLDGVLANFTKRVITVANGLWPGKMPLDYVPNSWNYDGLFSKEDWSLVWDEIKKTPKFWRDEEDQDSGPRELIHWLNNNPLAEVYYITSRVETEGDSVLVQSSQWLQIRGLWPRGGYSTVIPVADPNKKADIIEALKLPFFLDDYAVTVEGLQKIKGLKAYVLDQPWNKYADGLPRVFSVKEYLDAVNNATPNLSISR